MTTLMQDLRFGVRMLLKTPVVSAVAALSLALGIAANAAMFALMDGFLLEPLPFEDQHELVVLRELREGQPMEMAAGVAAPNLREYTEATSSFEETAAYTIERANLTGTDLPEQLQVVVAEPSLFDLVGVQPAFGRGFRDDEGAEGSGAVLVLQHDFWDRRFLGRRDVLGSTVTLDGVAYTVIGVMPEDFDMVPADVQAFRPADFRDREDRASHDLLAFARLRPGTDLTQVQRELAVVSDRLAAEYPDGKRGWDLTLAPVADWFPGPTDRMLVQILTAVAFFGLLIACANVANLLLGRAEVRQKEVAVRTALGAGRNRLLRQLLTESVTLGLAAGGLGVGLAIYVVRWLQGAMPPQMPSSMVPTLSPLVVAATVVVSIVAGIAFGLLPALHATGGSLREALGSGSRGGTVGRSRKRLRNAFVVGEFAVALALLAGAGFMIQAFDSFMRIDPGYQVDGLLTFQISVLEDRYDDDEAVVAYQDELLRSLEGVPGVSGVALMSALPRGYASSRTPYEVTGRPVADDGERPTADFQVVNPGYFTSMGIAIVQGRAIERSDRTDAQSVALISRALADREFPGEDPLGRSLEVRGTSRTVVGVVEDVQQRRISLAGEAGEAIYLPYAQLPSRNPSFAVRSSAGDPSSLAANIRQAVWAVEADQPVADVRTLQDYIDESLAGPRSISLFLTVMGGIALLLAAMGIYGVMSHSVTQRRKEIGIRMALGAGRGSVVGMVTRTGLALAGVGMLLGLPLAWIVFRGFTAAVNLFAGDVGISYAVTLTGALLAVAALSTWLPARRASGVSPVRALREE